MDLLAEKKQLILYGPPGTGKTYLAMRVARFLTGGAADTFTLVQFHPNYTYEMTSRWPAGLKTQNRPPGQSLSGAADAGATGAQSAAPGRSAGPWTASSAMRVGMPPGYGSGWAA